MWLKELWQRWIGGTRRSHERRQWPRMQAQTSLTLEALEDRTLLSASLPNIPLPYINPTNFSQMFSDIKPTDTTGAAGHAGWNQTANTLLNYTKTNAENAKTAGWNRAVNTSLDHMKTDAAGTAKPSRIVSIPFGQIKIDYSQTNAENAKTAGWNQTVNTPLGHTKTGTGHAGTSEIVKIHYSQIKLEHTNTNASNAKTAGWNRAVNTSLDHMKTDAVKVEWNRLINVSIDRIMADAIGYAEWNRIGNTPLTA